ncbi:MAG: hypothetical protein ACLPV4_20610 [Solirubrobacteraceae bacterium]
MNDETEIVPLSQWNGPLQPFFQQLRYHGLNRHERAEGDTELLTLLEDRLRLERGAGIRDLGPDVVREFVQQVEQNRRGRWVLLSSDSGDIFAALDAHFRDVQLRGQAEQARRAAEMDARIAGQARVDRQTAIYQENAARRTWGLPELEAEPDDVPASA